MFTVKAFFTNGASVASAETLSDAFDSWKRIIGSHGEDPFLMRCEVWSNETGLVAAYDVEGISLLTPALENIIHKRATDRSYLRSVK